jgi:S1-C subfamily serine protease
MTSIKRLISRAFSLSEALPLIFLFCSVANLQAENRFSGRKIFEKVKPQIFIVKTSTAPEAARRSYGSGFAFGENGMLITNFHVVSEAFQNPDVL